MLTCARCSAASLNELLMKLIARHDPQPYCCFAPLLADLARTASADEQQVQAALLAFRELALCLLHESRRAVVPPGTS